MSPPPSDRALRRLVADLAVSRPQDVTAILGELNASQREIVIGLIEEFHGSGAPLLLAQTPPPQRVAGLSSWLQSRLDGDMAAAPGFAFADGYVWDTNQAGDLDGAFTMTPMALEGLRTSAAGMAREVQSEVRSQSAPKWMIRLREFLGGSVAT